ncbi:MAG: STAS/SEC14 domain-containing protein [Rubrobacteraceae bacterium]
MLRRLDNGTGNVLGYEVKERITDKEFENLSREVKEIVAEHGKVRLLVRMDEIPKVGLDAMMEDLKLAPYANDIERYAVVGDASFLEWAQSLGDVFISGEIKHFKDSQYEEAWSWVQA